MRPRSKEEKMCAITTEKLYAKTMELARIFGISKSTMMRLRKRDGFPSPAYEIPMGSNSIKLYSIEEFGKFLENLSKQKDSEKS